MTAWGSRWWSGCCSPSVDWFTGPLATTWIGHNGLGWAATIVVSGALYAVLPRPARRRRSDGEQPSYPCPTDATSANVPLRANPRPAKGGLPSMAITVVRFNLVDPDATPESLSARYRAALEMAAYADDHGVDTVQTEEHHGSRQQLAALPLRLRRSGLRRHATGSRSPSRRSSARCTTR